MHKAVVNTLRRTLWLLPIPLIWILLSHMGALSFFENKAMDWRFRQRGEIDAPVKLIYVDLDAESFRDYLGERPWPRSEFGQISEILFVLGKVNAIGFDLVLSKFNASILVPQEYVDQDVEEFARVTNRNPNIILATAYSQGDDMPLIYKGETDLENFDFPETPHPRFIQRHGINQMGLIGYDQEISDGITPRWVPMFSEASKYGLNFTYYQIALQLARVSYGLPPEAIKRSEDIIELVDSNGLALLSIPLWGQQMLEINWFSKFYSQKIHVTVCCKSPPPMLFTLKGMKNNRHRQMSFSVNLMTPSYSSARPTPSFRTLLPAQWTITLSQKSVFTPMFLKLFFPVYILGVSPTGRNTSSSSRSPLS